MIVRLKRLDELLSDVQTMDIPVGKDIVVLKGKMLSKTPTWLKMILLVQIGSKKQLRLYAWQKNKFGQYKVRQKFNISKGYSIKLSEILMAFSTEED